MEATQKWQQQHHQHHHHYCHQTTTELNGKEPFFLSCKEIYKFIHSQKTFLSHWMENDFGSVDASSISKQIILLRFTAAMQFFPFRRCLFSFNTKQICSRYGEVSRCTSYVLLFGSSINWNNIASYHRGAAMVPMRMKCFKMNDYE